MHDAWLRHSDATTAMVLSMMLRSVMNPISTSKIDK
jgi:hypothetical protein